MWEGGYFILGLIFDFRVVDQSLSYHIGGLPMPSSNDILGVILGGGRGARLYPLTRDRSKPAVPIAGKHRLIDIPISNCINSGIFRIAVLTQFNTVSLHRHIARTYIFDSFHRGWVQILAAEQTLEGESWYQGTADAVRKQLLEIQTTGAEYVLVLAGDHIYRMDFRRMAEYHWQNNADITIAVQSVPFEQATRLGLLKQLEDGRIVDFVEKPKDPEVLSRFVSRNDPSRPFLGSMGIYLFKTSVLVDLLRSSNDDDFGGEVIPSAIGSQQVYGFNYDGFWQDIGTIRSFYETNLMLTRPDTPFNFYDPGAPIYTRMRNLPGSLIEGAKLTNVFLADGCRIQRADLNHSIIGLRSQIADGVKIRDSMLMGADYYESIPIPAGMIPLGIGPDCDIEGAILDKNVRIGAGVVIRPFSPGTEIDQADCVVRDGIVVIPKNTVLCAGTYIGPR
jgi:glucose-1-phosphate adenylyltransferase